MTPPIPRGSHRSNPILIDDNDPITEADREIERLRAKYLRDQRVRNPGLSAKETDEDAIEVEEEIAAEELERETIRIDLTQDLNEDEPTYRPHGRFPDPTPIISIRDGERELDQLEAGKDRLTVRKGFTVQLSHRISEQFNAQFLKIAAIVRLRNGNAVLRGHLYTRSRNLMGIMERKLNEVVLIADVIRDIAPDWNRQAMYDLSLEDVDCIRELRTTNTEYPECGFDKQLLLEKSKTWVAENCELVCRWQHVSVYKDRIMHDAGKPDEWLIRRITKGDADTGFAINDDVNINKWRGAKIPGGSMSPDGKHESALCIDLESVPRTPAQQRRKVQRRFYSGGDVFSGAGGASRGMADAEIKLLFAVDHWDYAVATYRRNFGDIVHEMDIFDFITSAIIKYRVDILHMSPPCQFWSPAHTIPGVNDEVNVAALYSCGHIIDKVRPRIFTVEQTFGILFKRFTSYFNTFIGALTSYGYSVRWKVVQFSGWGLCQKRRRLIVIGAAPGEHLPDFPKDTHFDKDGQQRLTTVKDVFLPLGRSLRAGQHQHDVAEAMRRNLKPWDWNTQLSTITCQGGQNNYHWSGRRDFTVREYAYLQGFPNHHSFEGPRGKCVKQIGNAVPPTMAKKLFEHIVKWLKIQDGAHKPDSMEVKASEARQRLERIKIGSGPDTDDDEVYIIMAPVQASAPADQGTTIDDSDGEQAASVCSRSDAGSGTSDGTAVGTHSPPPDAPCYVPPFDQLPPDAKCKLRPFRQFPRQAEAAGKTDKEDSDMADVDARSDTSCTIIGDDEVIEIVDLDPPEHIGGHPILQRRILTPVSRKAIIDRWQQEQARN